MPMYEYSCLHCEERFEKLVPLRAEHLPVTCPRCGTQEVRKLLSTFATTESNRTVANPAVPQAVAEAFADESGRS